MKPETLEAIKKEVEMSPVEWLEKEVKKRFGGETFTSVFSVEFERSKKMENDIIEGATKYAAILESEREKAKKLARALKLLQASINGGLDGLEFDNPYEIIEKSEVIKTFKEHNELIEKALTEYKTTSK